MIAFFNVYEFLSLCWSTLCELSPWLLLGMFLSGLLHVVLPQNFVRRRFRGLSGVVQSVFLGVPLPLCSCGVIPAGIGLKNDGASDGAAVGFLISTPQTGIDSILVSASFFGWPFAIFKMIAAAITGIAGGWVTELASDEQETDTETASVVVESKQNRYLPGDLWSHAMEILDSIWIWLLVGVAVSALIATLGVDFYVRQIGQSGLLPAMLVMLLVAVPMYVCATASVPIAAALVQSGLPPAVALVFLMAGPATNLTTMGAVKSRFGWKLLAIYLTTLIGGSFLAAALFDWLIESNVASGPTHVHQHQNLLSISSALVVLGLIGMIVLRRWNRYRTTESPHATEISISGMHCNACVNRIETAVGKLDSVNSIRVDLGRGKAFVEGTASDATLRQTIEALGFKVE